MERKKFVPTPETPFHGKRPRRLMEAIQGFRPGTYTEKEIFALLTDAIPETMIQYDAPKASIHGVLKAMKGVGLVQGTPTEANSKNWRWVLQGKPASKPEVVVASLDPLTVEQQVQGLDARLGGLMVYQEETTAALKELTRLVNLIIKDLGVKVG
jgi:hypothetical protein